MTNKHHEVPTHLDVEDRVLFGLTVRQFLYLLVGSSASYAVWDQTLWLADTLRAVCVVVCLATTLAFALVRPDGRSLEEWAVAALMYVAVPRRAVWQPAEPRPAEWLPAAASWQELAPSLAWAADDGG
ncbi:MAG: PrgI family protein [Chloroflexota bacterium]